jgi:hypothetical protein
MKPRLLNIVNTVIINLDEISHVNPILGYIEENGFQIHMKNGEKITVSTNTMKLAEFLKAWEGSE